MCRLHTRRPHAALVLLGANGTRANVIATSWGSSSGAVPLAVAEGSWLLSTDVPPQVPVDRHLATLLAHLTTAARGGICLTGKRLGFSKTCHLVAAIGITRPVFGVRTSVLGKHW